ncbi:cache domain-containing protein [Desulfocicer vacuolatum]|uniref:cache domain-containing protein n=1 Tax=Desulfocicer vacuolatum TaxID=2298 RepID=UPI001BB0A1E9|nr:cache domain-containing protein [Desulfocicer vacuolatum]
MSIPIVSDILHFFANLKIKTKLLGAYTLISVLAIFLGGAVIYHQVRITIEANIESELTNATAAIQNMVRTAAATSIKNHLRAIAEKNKEIVTNIYADFLKGLMTEEEAKLLCRKILFSQSIGKTGYIFCVTSSGIATEHPNPGVVGKNFLNRQFVKKMIEMKTGYLEYDWKNPEDVALKPKAMYISYFKPWDWVIAASSYREEFAELINISDFRKSILSLTFGKSGYTYIKDSLGNLIVHPFMTGNYFDAKDKYGEYFVRKICRLKNGKAVYTWKNPGETIERDKMVIFKYIPEYDWIVASTTYLDEIFAPLNTVRNIVFTIILLICVFVFCTSLWINAGVIRPLQNFMKQFALGASGDFNIRMPVKSTDEIGQLADYFNRFMDTLNNYATNLHLEMNQHKMTAQALRSSEEKYRTILERMEEGYFEVDLSGSFSFCNHAMVRMLGKKEDEIMGTRIYNCMNLKNCQALEKIFTIVRQSGKAKQLSDLELIRSDCTLCTVEASVSLRKSSDNTPKGFSGVLRDISERKKNEKALRLSEEMFSKAFRSSPSAMFIAALKDSRIINVNDRFLAVTGHSLFELIGKELSGNHFFYHSMDWKKMMASLSEKALIKNREITFLTAAGEKRTGMISMEQIFLWGESCILGAIEDMTDSRRLEREILIISERERQKLAMELHDDLCPQLIGIEVMTKMLQQRLHGNKGDGCLDNEADRAGKIRSLILDSIEKTRRMSRGLSPVNLTELGFDASLEELATYVREVFNISCTLCYDVSPPFEDITIATHAYYIVHEAVHNAVKHARAKNIYISLTNEDETARLEVRDDGMGFKTSAVFRGMGMQIMRYRAGRIGAVLDVKAAPNGGTIVGLTLEIDVSTGV